MKIEVIDVLSCNIRKNKGLIPHWVEILVNDLCFLFGLVNPIAQVAFVEPHLQQR